MSAADAAPDAAAPPAPVSVAVTGGGEPSAEEVAAVMAAVGLLLSGGHGHAEAAPPTPRWRFSGRWWTKPIPARRERP